MQDLTKFPPWREFNIEFAILFGSRAGGKIIKGDWDIAVWFNDINEYADLLASLARFLGVREDLVDLVPLNHRLPCQLIIEILRHRPIYVRDIGKYLDIRFRLQNPCIDFFISMRKLGLGEPPWPL
ncbi:nucleotidyltransferase domain-containing protein [Vulcanisaeta distributa]|uniref:nucleotidyltransferase domain-containing protein n=1 Tax=Vulcanisaeta distributa TaxID=164451 RepID=UPI0006D0A89E|nr:nucleotidyltransferase domain-containing protein [Vulcanisaeta distributa]